MMDYGWIFKAFPELDYVRRWCEAMDEKQYEDALKIVNAGLKEAKNRRSQFVKLLRDLQQETRLSLRELSADPREKAQIRKQREAKLFCYFCGKKRAQVSILLAGAGGFICGSCVKSYYQAIKTKKLVPSRAKGSSPRGKKISCSFCGKKPTETATIVAGVKAYLCDGCIKHCYEYIKKEGPMPDSTKRVHRTGKNNRKRVNKRLVTRLGELLKKPR